MRRGVRSLPAPRPQHRAGHKRRLRRQHRRLGGSAEPLHGCWRRVQFVFKEEWGHESMRRRPEGGIRLRRNTDTRLDRAFALMMCGFGLAACSSFTMPGFDAMKAK